MPESPADRVRRRLSELGVGPVPADEAISSAADLDAIDVRSFRDDTVQVSDRAGNSWTGSADRVLGALADMEPTGEPSEVWERLDRPA